MFINHQFKNASGEISLGIGANNGRIFVRIIQAHLFNVPDKYSVLEEVMLERLSDHEHVLRVMEIPYWDEYIHLSSAAVHSIDWKRTEVLLFDLHKNIIVDEIKVIDHDMGLLLATRDRLLRAKDEADAAAKGNLFQKAMNIVTSVIFRLTSL